MKPVIILLNKLIRKKKKKKEKPGKAVCAWCEAEKTINDFDLLHNFAITRTAI